MHANTPAELPPDRSRSLTLATWNVNSLKARLPLVLTWLLQAQPDVVALQELKLEDSQFPVEAFASLGYQAVWRGQKAYNGVALLARAPLDWGQAQRALPTLPDDPQARFIAAPVLDDRGEPLVLVAGVYCPNGQAPGTDKFDYKLRWFDALHQWVRQARNAVPPLVLMGDFNITFDDRDVWDPVTLRDTIHCTDEERAALHKLLDAGLVDALRVYQPEGNHYTWWDYRQLAFPKNRGLRIDHILVAQELGRLIQGCHVERALRKATQPSDHAPVVATLSWPP